MLDSVGAFIIGMIRYSTPLLYVSLGVLVMEATGVLNMGAEGMMILGCFTAVAGTNATGSIWAGFLLAMLVCGGFALLFGWLAVGLSINQTVLGIAFNLVGAGLTTTLNRTFLKGVTLKQHFATDRMGFSAPVYLAFLITIVLWVVMYKTKAGIIMRSVGENPLVAESVGMSVPKVRYIACGVAGMFVGAGGAFLATGLLSSFTENMTEGRGFLALAAVTFGKYTPFGTLVGVLVFGTGEMASYRMQVSSTVIPYEFALMIPYILVLLAMSIFSRNGKDPAALAVPYTKEL